MTNPKFIYKSEKPYTEDINDLIEKGGKGSGVKGHTTSKDDMDPNPKAGETATQAAQRRQKAVHAHNEKILPGITEALNRNPYKK